jgi:hypothetical protein
MHLCLVPHQLSLFRLEAAPPAAYDGRHSPHLEMDNTLRDRRTGDQWRRSIIAYLLFRAGEPWRSMSDPAHRNDPCRWEYLDAVRLLDELRYAPAAAPALKERKERIA